MKIKLQQQTVYYYLPGTVTPVICRDFTKSQFNAGNEFINVEFTEKSPKKAGWKKVRLCYIPVSGNYLVYVSGKRYTGPSGVYIFEEAENKVQSNKSFWLKISNI